VKITVETASVGVSVERAVAMLKSRPID